MGRKIPDGWLKYRPIGERIVGTKFVAFKVPLKNEIVQQLPEDHWFTPEMLVDKLPALKLIVDLTNTNRYYDPKEFLHRGIDHVKIYVEGGGNVPPPVKLREFYAAVDAFLEKSSGEPDALVGVHCTHGLNRTGYFVCSYLVQRLKMTPTDALQCFEAARGHPMERMRLVDNIKKLRPEYTRFRVQSYGSPLEDAYGGEWEYQSYSRRKYNGRDNWRERARREYPRRPY